MNELFNLVEYRERNDSYTAYRVHVINRPYGVCKSRKKELESGRSRLDPAPDNVKFFFKIEKPKTN